MSNLLEVSVLEFMDEFDLTIRDIEHCLYLFSLVFKDIESSLEDVSVLALDSVYSHLGQHLADLCVFSKVIASRLN